MHSGYGRSRDGHTPPPIASLSLLTPQDTEVASPSEVRCILLSTRLNRRLKENTSTLGVLSPLDPRWKFRTSQLRSQLF